VDLHSLLILNLMLLHIDSFLRESTLLASLMSFYAGCYLAGLWLQSLLRLLCYFIVIIVVVCYSYIWLPLRTNTVRNVQPVQ
jgi:hypothetical protein